MRGWRELRGSWDTRDRGRRRVAAWEWASAGKMSGYWLCVLLTLTVDSIDLEFESRNMNNVGLGARLVVEVTGTWDDSIVEVTEASLDSVWSSIRGACFGVNESPLG